MDSPFPNRRSRTSITIFTVLAVFGGYFVLHVLGTIPWRPILPALTWNSSPTVEMTYHNYTSAYSFDLDLAKHAAWMARIPDHITLNALSIPGTHDTLTYDLVTNPGYQCQNHDLATQLRAGLRYFDIRGRLVYNASATAGEDGEETLAPQPPVIAIYHGHVPTGYDFEYVLQTVFAFLDENPSEGVILRVKEEGAPLPMGSPAENWASGIYNVTFEEAFNYYRLKHPLTAPGCAQHLLTPWPPSSPDSGSSNSRLVPTVGEMRGRALVLYEFPTGPAADYGIAWTSPHIALEDMWIILAPELLEAKWDAVRKNLELAAVSADDSDVLFLSHLSASVGVLPIEAAAGPLPDRTNGTEIKGINERTGKWLEGEFVAGAAGKTGVIMADFPGRRLVEGILRWNEWLVHEEEGW